MPALHLTIPFDSAEEQRIAAAAKQIGLAPEELVKRLALENLPSLPTGTEDAVVAKLRLWQQQDGTPLMPDVPSKTLFAQWAEEGTAMSDEERDAEDRQSEDIETSLAENRGLCPRGSIVSSERSSLACWRNADRPPDGRPYIKSRVRRTLGRRPTSE